MRSDPLLRPGPLGGVAVAWADLDDPPEAAATLEASLSPEERARADRFLFAVDRRRFVAARGLLRRLVGGQIGVPAPEVRLVADALGKPRLGAGQRRDVRFNLSHAAGRALYGFVDGLEIGVDTERVRPLPDMDAVARRVFSPGELRDWLDLPEPQRQEAFFAGWTRKEAVVKALGQGLGYPLDAFDVALAPGQPVAVLRIADGQGPASRWSMASWSPEPGFLAALVIDRGSGTSGEWPATGAGGAPRDPPAP